MKVKFFADDFNDRRAWGWTDGVLVTADPVQIEEFKGLGVRWEDVEPVEVKQAVKEARVKAEKKVAKRESKKKV